MKKLLILILLVLLLLSCSGKCYIDQCIYVELTDGQSFQYNKAKRITIGRNDITVDVGDAFPLNDTITIGDDLIDFYIISSTNL